MRVPFLQALFAASGIGAACGGSDQAHAQSSSNTEPRQRPNPFHDILPLRSAKAAGGPAGFRFRPEGRRSGEHAGAGDGNLLACGLLGAGGGDRFILALRSRRWVLRNVRSCDAHCSFQAGERFKPASLPPASVARAESRFACCRALALTLRVRPPSANLIPYLFPVLLYI